MTFPIDNRNKKLRDEMKKLHSMYPPGTYEIPKEWNVPPGWRYPEQATVYEQQWSDSSPLSGDRITTAPRTMPDVADPEGYIIQPGDSWSSIAQTKYGDQTYWTTLQRSNPQIRGSLQPGQRILLPDYTPAGDIGDFWANPDFASIIADIEASAGQDAEWLLNAEKEKALLSVQEIQLRRGDPIYLGLKQVIDENGNLHMEPIFTADNAGIPLMYNPEAGGGKGGIVYPEGTLPSDYEGFEFGEGIPFRYGLELYDEKVGGEHTIGVQSGKDGIQFVVLDRSGKVVSSHDNREGAENAVKMLSQTDPFEFHRQLLESPQGFAFELMGGQAAELTGLSEEEKINAIVGYRARELDATRNEYLRIINEFRYENPELKSISDQQIIEGEMLRQQERAVVRAQEDAQRMNIVWIPDPAKPDDPTAMIPHRLDMNLLEKIFSHPAARVFDEGISQFLGTIPEEDRLQLTGWASAAGVMADASIDVIDTMNEMFQSIITLEGSAVLFDLIASGVVAAASKEVDWDPGEVLAQHGLEPGDTGILAIDALVDMQTSLYRGEGLRLPDDSNLAQRFADLPKQIEAIKGMYERYMEIMEDPNYERSAANIDDALVINTIEKLKNADQYVEFSQQSVELRNTAFNLYKKDPARTGEAIDMMIEANELDSQSRMFQDPRWTYTWQAYPDKKEEFLRAEAMTSLQLGRPLSDAEIQILRNKYEDLSVELPARMVLDLTNVPPLSLVMNFLFDSLRLGLSKGRAGLNALDSYKPTGALLDRVFGGRTLGETVQYVSDFKPVRRLGEIPVVKNIPGMKWVSGWQPLRPLTLGNLPDIINWARSETKITMARRTGISAANHVRSIGSNVHYAVRLADDIPANQSLEGIMDVIGRYVMLDNLADDAARKAAKAAFDELPENVKALEDTFKELYKLYDPRLVDPAMQKIAPDNWGKLIRDAYDEAASTRTVQLWNDFEGRLNQTYLSAKRALVEVEQALRQVDNAANRAAVEAAQANVQRALSERLSALTLNATQQTKIAQQWALRQTDEVAKIFGGFFETAFRAKHKGDLYLTEQMLNGLGRRFGLLGPDDVVSKTSPALLSVPQSVMQGVGGLLQKFKGSWVVSILVFVPRWTINNIFDSGGRMMAAGGSLFDSLARELDFVIKNDILDEALMTTFVEYAKGTGDTNVARRLIQKVQAGESFNTLELMKIIFFEESGLTAAWKQVEGASAGTKLSSMLFGLPGGWQKTATAVNQYFEFSYRLRTFSRLFKKNFNLLDNMALGKIVNIMRESGATDEAIEAFTDAWKQSGANVADFEDYIDILAGKSGARVGKIDSVRFPNTVRAMMNDVGIADEIQLSVLHEVDKRLVGAKTIEDVDEALGSMIKSVRDDLTENLEDLDAAFKPYADMSREEAWRLSDVVRPDLAAESPRFNTVFEHTLETPEPGFVRIWRSQGPGQTMKEWGADRATAELFHANDRTMITRIVPQSEWDEAVQQAIDGGGSSTRLEGWFDDVDVSTVQEVIQLRNADQRVIVDSALEEIQKAANRDEAADAVLKADVNLQIKKTTEVRGPAIRQVIDPDSPIYDDATEEFVQSLYKELSIAGLDDQTIDNIFRGRTPGQRAKRLAQAWKEAKITGSVDPFVDQLNRYEVIAMSELVPGPGNDVIGFTRDTLVKADGSRVYLSTAHTRAGDAQAVARTNVENLVRTLNDESAQLLLDETKVTILDVADPQHGVLATTTPEGQIKIKAGVTHEDVIKYLEDVPTSPAGKQKAEVLNRLANEGISLDDIKKQITTPEEARDFLVAHGMSHVRHGDMSRYWDEGQDLLSPDKIEIEVRAFKDALDPVAAQRAAVDAVQLNQAKVTYLQVQIERSTFMRDKIRKFALEVFPGPLFEEGMARSVGFDSFQEIDTNIYRVIAGWMDDARQLTEAVADQSALDALRRLENEPVGVLLKELGLKVDIITHQTGRNVVMIEWAGTERPYRTQLNSRLSALLQRLYPDVTIRLSDASELLSRPYSLEGIQDLVVTDFDRMDNAAIALGDWYEGPYANAGPPRLEQRDVSFGMQVFNAAEEGARVSSGGMEFIKEGNLLRAADGTLLTTDEDIANIILRGIMRGSSDEHPAVMRLLKQFDDQAFQTEIINHGWDTFPRAELTDRNTFIAYLESRLKDKSLSKGTRTELNETRRQALNGRHNTIGLAKVFDSRVPWRVTDWTNPPSRYTLPSWAQYRLKATETMVGQADTVVKFLEDYAPGSFRDHLYNTAAVESITWGALPQPQHRRFLLDIRDRAVNLKLAAREGASLGTDDAIETFRGPYEQLVQELYDIAGVPLRDGATKVTNKAMIDYGTETNFDNLMRNIFPFWRFQSRSIPYWAEWFARNPRYASAYFKHLRYSRIAQIQDGIIDTRGDPVMSAGYIRIPGTDKWLNPLSPMSFRSTFSLLVRKSARDGGRGDPAISFFTDFMSVHGISAAPWITVPLQQAGLLDANVFPSWTTFPQVDLIPSWWQRDIENIFSRIDKPLDGPVWGAENPWLDTKVEQVMLSTALEDLQSATSEEERRAIVRELEAALGYEVLERGQFGEPKEWKANPVRTHDRWNTALREVQNSDWWTRFTSYMTAAYVREFDDSELNLRAQRMEINMLRDSINNQMLDFILPVMSDEDGNILTREEQYQSVKYDTPEGEIVNLYSQLGWVEAPPDIELRQYPGYAPGDRLYGEARRLETAQMLYNNEVRSAYWDSVMLVIQERDAQLAALPFGVDDDEISKIYEEADRRLSQVNSSPIFPDEVRNPSYSPINKSYDTLQEHYLNERFAQISQLRPVYDPAAAASDPNYYAKYTQAITEWEAIVMSDLVDRSYDLILVAIEQDLGKYDVLPRYLQELNPPQLAKQVADQISFAAYENWRKSKHSPWEAGNAAWEEMYWKPFWASVSQYSSLERTRAERQFFTENPQPTIEDVVDWILEDETYSEMWTREELMEALGGNEILSIDDRLSAAEGSPEALKDFGWDLMGRVPPGANARKALEEAFRIIGGNYEQVQTWFDTSGDWPLTGGSDKANTFLKDLEAALDYLGWMAPTDVQLDEWIEVKNLNEDFKLGRDEILSKYYTPEWQTILEAYWAAAPYSDERKEMRKEHGDLIDDYYDLRCEFASQYPLWGKYFLEEDDCKEGGGTRSGGGQSRRRSGGGGGYSYSDARGAFIPAGYRSTYQVRELFDPKKLGSGGVGGYPYWPPGFSAGVPGGILREITNRAENGVPLSDAAKKYMSSEVTLNKKIRIEDLVSRRADGTIEFDYLAWLSSLINDTGEVIPVRALYGGGESPRGPRPEFR